MQIQDVENMTAAELVKRKAEIIAGLTETTQDELADRYVQARTDAKLRDEKLAEQATTLEALQSGNKAIREQLEAKETECDGLFHDLTVAQQREANFETAIADHKTLIKSLQERSNRLVVHADAFNQAITSIQKTATDAIAARDLAKTSEGE